VKIAPKSVEKSTSPIIQSLDTLINRCLSPPEKCRKALQREISAGLFFFIYIMKKRKDKKQRRKSILMKLCCYNGSEGKGKEDLR
jgi:hypothetical protein